MKINKRTSYFIKEDFQDNLITELKEFVQLKDLDLVELQCLGYGLFDQIEALKNFRLYFDRIKTLLFKVEKNFTLTITISGFNFLGKDQENFLSGLAKDIGYLQQKLSQLNILTSNLQNVTKSNFQDFFNLAQNGNKEFKKFNLQCSNWNFLQKKNPTFKDLQKIFSDFCSNARKNPLYILKFRLQLSAWYHQFNQALNFLGFYDQKSKPPNTQFNAYDQSKFPSVLQSEFFNGMEKLLRQFYKVLPQLQNFQLDLRNNNQVLKLKNLKKKLNTMNIQQHTQPGSTVQINSLMNAIFTMANVRKNQSQAKKKTVTLNYIV